MLVRIEHLSFSYNETQSAPPYALTDVNLEIDDGEYVAIAGHNGSGKTTLLKHLNALLLPTGGDVWVSGLNTRDRGRLTDVRRVMGMVFQDPAAQIIQSTVEEEVAFGPENLGVSPEEIAIRVARALRVSGLEGLGERPCGFLSIGQKQLLSIAAALAMEPRCLLLDEATSMLDWPARVRFIETIEGLHRRGMAVVSVTQDMDEAARAERVIVLSEGRVAMDGPPREILTRVDRLTGLGLEAPSAVRLARKIGETLPGFPCDLFTVSELADEIERMARGKRHRKGLRSHVGAEVKNA
jgi:energy-coupling factor transport system ATP-binding protein